MAVVRGQPCYDSDANQTSTITPHCGGSYLSIMNTVGCKPMVRSIPSRTVYRMVLCLARRFFSSIILRLVLLLACKNPRLEFHMKLGTSDGGGGLTVGGHPTTAVSSHLLVSVMKLGSRMLVPGGLNGER